MEPIRIWKANCTPDILREKIAHITEYEKLKWVISIPIEYKPEDFTSLGLSDGYAQLWTNADDGFFTVCLY